MHTDDRLIPVPNHRCCRSGEWRTSGVRPVPEIKRESTAGSWGYYRARRNQTDSPNGLHRGQECRVARQGEEGGE